MKVKGREYRPNLGAILRTEMKIKDREYKLNLGGENKGKWTFDPGANVNWFVHREKGGW